MMNRKLQSIAISLLIVLSALAIFIPSSTADTGSYILRPNAIGKYTNWNPVGAVNNWQCVDEVVQDNLSTYVYKIGGQVDDLYNVTDPTSHIGTVTNITVHAKWWAWEQAGKIGIYANAEYYFSDWIFADYHGGYWEEITYTYDATGELNWNDVDSMQIGIRSDYQSANSTVTQMWVEVFYSYTDDPPEILGVSVFPEIQRTGNFINITTEVTDDFNNISTVKVNITYPNSSTANITMDKGSGDIYYYNTTYNQLGMYSCFVWANDTTGHSASTSAEPEIFEIIDTNTFYVFWEYTEEEYGFGIFKFDKIQDAIDNASSNAKIYVYGGTYNENIYIDKSLNMTGLYGENKPLINGVSATKSTIEIMVDWGNISGFAINNTAGVGNNYHCISIGKSGAQLEDHFNWSVKDCNIINCYYGTLLRGGYYNVSNCDIDAVTAGIYSLGPSLDRDTYNTIYNNSLHDAQYGIDLYLSYNNTIWRNNISKNTLDGIQIGLSHYNTIYENDFYDNNAFGIDISASCNYNKIYHNNFIKNNEPSGKQADDDVANTNYWDDGYTTSGGNYWDDFDEPGEGAWDNNSDYVVDSPYTFIGGQDNYPLIVEDGWELMSVLNISLTPNSVDFGTILVNSYNMTINYHFNITNNGDTCDIKVTVSNSQNWTFVNYTDIGHDKFTMNWSDDNWSSENNIKIGGTNIVEDLQTYYIFDLKFICPTSISESSNGESITITLTAIAI